MTTECKCGRHASVTIQFEDGSVECWRCYNDWAEKAREVNRAAQDKGRLEAERREARKQALNKKGKKHGSEQDDSNW